MKKNLKQAQNPLPMQSEIEADQEYLCPSDSRTYKINRVKYGKDASVSFRCIDCLTKNGEAIMSLDEFEKAVKYGRFVLKKSEEEKSV
jgi:hypothetical protein